LAGYLYAWSSLIRTRSPGFILLVLLR
jgi:hypothetical protein